MSYKKRRILINKKNRKKTKKLSLYIESKTNIAFKIFFIVILLSFINYKKLKIYGLNKKVIGVDISIRDGSGGPVVLTKSISKVLPYQTKFCQFVPINGIYPNISKNIDYIYKSYHLMDENTYDEWIKIKRANILLLGPCFVPNVWQKFQSEIFWNERRFREILSTIKGVVVHSDRVREHLVEKSNTQNLFNKYILLRPCTHIIPKDIK